MAVKKIYVSFRQADSAASYGRITERLIAYFGTDALLRRDSNSISESAGSLDSEYRAALEEMMADCGVVVLVIGPRWIEDTTEDRRIDDPNDAVRMEIEAALRRGIPIIPTLVQGAAMPAPELLPPSVRLLTEQGQVAGRTGTSESLLGLICRTGLPVRQDPDFHGDTLRLCEVIESFSGLMPDDPQRAVRRLRNTTLSAILTSAGALAIHGVALAVLADRWLLPNGTPHPPQSLSTLFWVALAWWAPLLDVGVIVAAAVNVGRRTGDLAASIMAAIAVELGASVTAALAFGVVSWANWPIILQGGTDSSAYVLLLILVGLGIPIGIGVSIFLGIIGGGIGQSRYHANKLRQQEQRREVLAGAPVLGPGARMNTTPTARKQSGPRQAPATIPGKVFISYRRSDSAIMCGAIYERLVDIFGVQAIFKDVDMIPIGANFQAYIDATLRQSRVQLIIIGPNWLDIRGADGRRRLDDSGDFVRMEIESALRLGLTVIPVLVQGATLPAAADLPESLRPLVSHGALSVRVEPDFDADMRHMASIVWPTMQIPVAPPNAWRQRVPGVRIPRAPGETRAALRAYAPLLLVFALCGLVPGLVISRMVVAPPSAPTDTASALTIVGSFLALVLLGMGTSVHIARRSHQISNAISNAISVPLMGVIATFAVATTTIAIYGGLLRTGVDKTSTDHATFIGEVIFAAVIALAGAIVLLLPILAITGWIGGSLLSDFGPFRRAMLLVADASDSADSHQALAGLRIQFGRRVVSLTTLLATSGAGPRDAIERAMRRCAAVVALLGPGWDRPDGHGAQPLKQAVEAAMAAQKPIIPVLLTGASMPPQDQLSLTGRKLAMLNATSVRRAPDFPIDMRRLNAAITRITRIRPAWRITTGGGVALLVVLLAIVALVTRGVYFDNTLVLSSAHNDQAAAFGVVVMLAALDCIIYLLIGMMVTRGTGRIGVGILTTALTALIGNSVTDVYLGILLSGNGAPVAVMPTQDTLTNLATAGVF